MLIKEEYMTYTLHRTNSMKLLEEMTYIEQNISPALVPVVESNRLGSYIIDLDDIMGFSEQSNTEDLGHCLALIGESNQINPDNVVFSIDGYRLLEDNNLAEITTKLLSEGVSVYQKPLSYNSPAYLLAEEAIYAIEEENDTTLFESYLNDDFIFLEEKLTASQKRERKSQRKLMHINYLANTGKIKPADALEVRGKVMSHQPKSSSSTGVNQSIQKAIGIDKVFGNDALRSKGTLKRSMKTIIKNGFHPAVRDAVHQANIERRIGSIDADTHKGIIQKLSALNTHLANKDDEEAKDKAKGIMKDLENQHRLYFDHPDVVMKDRNSKRQETDKFVKSEVKMGFDKFHPDNGVNQKDQIWKDRHKLEKSVEKDNARQKTMERVASSPIADKTYSKLKTLKNMIGSSGVKLDPAEKREFETIEQRLTSGSYVQQNEYGRLSKRLNKLISYVDNANKQAKNISSVVKPEQNEQSQPKEHQDESHKEILDSIQKSNEEMHKSVDDNAEAIASVGSLPQNDGTVQQVSQTIQNAEKEAENKPKSWLAKKIYALRQLYSKWLQKKNQEHDQKKIGFFSNILRIITKGIDFLLKKLQNATDSK